MSLVSNSSQQEDLPTTQTESESNKIDEATNENTSNHSQSDGLTQDVSLAASTVLSTNSYAPPSFTQPFFTNPFMATLSGGSPQEATQSHVSPAHSIGSTISQPANMPGATPEFYQHMMQQYMQTMMQQSFLHAQAAANQATDVSKPQQPPPSIPGMMPQFQDMMSMFAQLMSAQQHFQMATSASNTQNASPIGETQSPSQPEPHSTEPSECEIVAEKTDEESQLIEPETLIKPESHLMEEPELSPEEVKKAATVNRAAELIKKQMTEIEKEISRRVGNQNIQAVDYRELESLLLEKKHQAEQLQQLGDSNIEFTDFATHESALPPSSTLTVDFTPSQFNTAKTENQQPSLNDMIAASNVSNAAPPGFAPRINPFNCVASGSTTPLPSAFSPVPQINQKPIDVMQPVDQTFLPQFQAHNGSAAPLANSGPFTPEYAAALLAQIQKQQHLQQSVPDSEGPSLAWPQSDTNGHLDKENGHNEDVKDPVWVMRDNYAKRLAREGKYSEPDSIDGDIRAKSATAPTDSDTDMETDRLLGLSTATTTSSCNQRKLSKTSKQNTDDDDEAKGKKKKEVIVHEPAVLIEGVLFRARYLGSTQLLCEGRPNKATRMMQAQEAVTRIKAPDGERQPSCDVDLFISTEKIMVLNTDLQRISETDVRQDIMMDHPLRTISYIADIGNVVVLMARRITAGSNGNDSENESDNVVRKTPKMICHVFESPEASFIAQSIGQAFQVAYTEFLRANGIEDPGYLREIDYQEVLNSQEIFGDELDMFAHKEKQKDIVIPKAKGEPLGIVIVESGWGSMVPTVVIANLCPTGAAARSNMVNIGDQVISVNGISLVGLQLPACQNHVKNMKNVTAVRMTIVPTPPVVEVRIKRPDTKYQLGFSVQNGVICSLLRGGIAERGGIRVGHRIIEINSNSVVAVPHDRIVNMLATAVGEIQMKTMPTSMFRLLTGQETPNYI